MNKKFIAIALLNVIILAGVVYFVVTKNSDTEPQQAVVIPKTHSPNDDWKEVKTEALPQFPQRNPERCDTLQLGDKLIVADALNKKVICYDAQNNIVWEITGYEGQTFKVPSPYLSVTEDGEGGFWVTDPGRKQLVQFDINGKYKSTWEPNVEMLGCCNPTKIRLLSHGRFLTLEKGEVRARIFSPSGDVESVVAQGADFSPSMEFLYDIELIDDDNIKIIDGIRKENRFFRSIKK